MVCIQRKCFRLESYDRNENFVNDPVILPPTLLPNWPANGFRQILHSHREVLPPVLEGHIIGYFMYRVASDNMANSDIAALQGTACIRSHGNVQFLHHQQQSFLHRNCQSNDEKEGLQ